MTVVAKPSTIKGAAEKMRLPPLHSPGFPALNGKNRESLAQKETSREHVS